MFLDLKLGIVWALLVGFVFGEPITIFWIFMGVCFALLPDIDFWIEFAQRGTVGGKTLGAHRTLLHNPLTYIPLTLFIGSVFGPAWMTLFGLGVFGHFVHDSMGMGWGIRWLWPLSLNWHKFFSDREGNIRYGFKHFFVSWTPTEMTQVITAKGNDNWLKEEFDHSKHNLFSLSLTFLAFFLSLVFLVLLVQKLS